MAGTRHLTPDIPNVTVIKCFPSRSHVAIPEALGLAEILGGRHVMSVIVEVEVDSGRVGIGLSTGGEAAAFIINKHLVRAK